MPRPSLSIQSKLLLLMISLSICSIVTIGYLGYDHGKEALTRSISNHLTSLRASKAYQLESYLKQIQHHVQSLAEDPAVVLAMRSFRDAHRDLGQATLTEKQSRDLLAFYRQQFLPQLASSVEGTPLAENNLPASPSGQYLQYRYIANNPHAVGKKKLLDTADDGSSYDQVHHQYHPLFRSWIERFGYYDMLLVDLKSGDIVYSVDKEVDFAGSLVQGSLSESNLSSLLRAVRKSPDRGMVKIVDYEAYRPSYMAPAAFIGSLIFHENEAIGMLALQLPIDEIDRVMTGNRSWRSDGLGDSGEAYLVGRDYKMRSQSRFFIESPKEYFASLRSLGVHDRELDRIRRFGTTILEQQVRSPASERALAGQSGTDVIRDYRGIPVLSSYMPLRIEGLDWVILVEIDLAEAFAPVYAFQHRVLVAACVLILLITISALVMTSWFLRPLQTIIGHIANIKDRQLERIPQQGNDEYGLLAQSVNSLIDSARSTAAEIAEKNQENEKLLRSILPAVVVRRLRAGERDIVVSYSHVSVLHSQVQGIDALLSRGDAEAGIALLSELVGALDDAAERCQVEKLRTSGPHYVAVCGLTTARLDHPQRIVDFALELARVVQAFASQHRVELAVQIGLHAGPLLGGVLGRRQLNFDLFGDTLQIAEALQKRCPADFIYLSKEIYQSIRIHDSIREAEPLTVRQQVIPVYACPTLS